MTPSEARTAYEDAVQNLREVIAACQVGPNSMDQRDEMADTLAKALEAFEKAKEALWGTERETP